MFLKINRNHFFKLYSCCQLTKGHSRSLIVDLQRNKFHFIPNILFEILTEDQFLSFSLLKEKYFENIEIITEYFQFLLNEDLGFIIKKSELINFPELNLNWENSSKITNAIIDLNAKSDFNLIEDSIKKLEQLKCFSIQLRIFDNISNNKLIKLSNYFKNTAIRNFDIILKYDKNKNLDFFEKLINTNQRLFNINIHSSPENIIKNIVKWNINCNFSTLTLDSPNCCGIIKPAYFTINLMHFTESQKHNTCLNRKISIDVNGEIKNCPSMLKSYGNIRDTTLSEALERPGFKDMWYIHKDQIEVCKDCEFRHICTDCRAFVKTSNNIYSKPSKCNYNPYEAKWED
jgi:SPASM domain peptide maturase of grasp-with-spasm system